MNHSQLSGFWKIKSNRVRNEDGSWLEDSVSGGRVAFSNQESFCIFFRSPQGTWGYSGSYQIADEKLLLTVDACTAEDMEGLTLERDIQTVNSDELIYRGVEFHTGRAFEARLSRAE